MRTPPAPLGCRRPRGWVHSAADWFRHDNADGRTQDLQSSHSAGLRAPVRAIVSRSAMSEARNIALLVSLAARSTDVSPSTVGARCPGPQGRCPPASRQGTSLLPRVFAAMVAYGSGAPAAPTPSGRRARGRGVPRGRLPGDAAPLRVNLRAHPVKNLKAWFHSRDTSDPTTPHGGPWTCGGRCAPPCESSSPLGTRWINFAASLLAKGTLMCRSNTLRVTSHSTLGPLNVEGPTARES